MKVWKLVSFWSSSHPDSDGFTVRKNFSVQSISKLYVKNVTVDRRHLSKQISYRNVGAKMQRLRNRGRYWVWWIKAFYLYFLAQILSNLHHYTSVKIPICILCKGLPKETECLLIECSLYSFRVLKFSTIGVGGLIFPWQGLFIIWTILLRYC